MAARFLLLRNGGSPSRWDGERYFEYLSTVEPSLPPDLRSLVAADRYNPSAESSLWHAQITSIHIVPSGIVLDATSDSGLRHFEFKYSGVRKVEASLRIYYMPSIVVQELVVMRNGVLRHSFSDLRGNISTIYASGLSFHEGLVQ
jgi:hypothetical protein